MLNPDWSDQTDGKGYEVHTALVDTARVGQSLTTVLDMSRRAPAGGIGSVGPARKRGNRGRRTVRHTR